MAASFNRVILVGNLTRDPEVRYIPSGSAVCDIGLAVNRTWFDKGSNQRKEEVTFVDVTLWQRTAEVAGEYLSKGSSVLVEGYLKMDTWQDKQTGGNRSKLKVVADTMQMLGSRGGDSPGGGGGQPGGGQGNSAGGYQRRGRPQSDPQESGPPDQSGGDDGFGAESYYDETPDDIGGDEVPF